MVLLSIFFLLSSVLVRQITGEPSDMEPRLIPQSFPGRCRRTPPGVVSGKESGTNGFSIKISGNPDKYQPGELYTVTLQGIHVTITTQKFIGFMLIVEPKETRNDISARPEVGTFQLFGDALSKFSEDCPNAITHTSNIPKSEIQVMWKAPPAGTGCVIFKATIQESKEKWYSEVGSLIRELCEEEQENQDEQPEIVEECCACDEAKYEITFEGLWSRHTHPKDFPANEWLIHFSEIIGASHSIDFRMWEYGGLASDGVKQIATRGSTKKMESELKMESNKIRTIIKARGLWYPSVNGKTFAVFRVDKVKHLMSFLTMLGPSPDWIVGVSALELCLKNCSWVNEKVMNLYPWDAGVDSGMSYISAKSTTDPADKIKRITSSNPNSNESPFYDPTGTPMKPVAKLTVSRQRVYEKPCEGWDPYASSTLPDIPDDVDERMECRVTEWTQFNPCSVSCGQGFQMRRRNYYNDQKAKMVGCSVPLIEKISCEELCVGNISCKTTEWGEWSECTVTCGKGLRTRSRKYLDNRARKACALELMEKESCMGMKPFCETDDRNVDPKCFVTHWSEWSPCTATCGKGLKVRTRLYMNTAAISMCNVELMQKAPCTADKPDCIINIGEAKKICMQPKEVGPCRGYFPRWYYDVTNAMCMQFIYGGCRGNKNKFERYTDCNRMCEMMLKDDKDGEILEYSVTLPTPSFPIDHGDQPQIDCMVTPWSEWTACSQTCGEGGRKERRRMIKVLPENGGEDCPDKLEQRKRCNEHIPCTPLSALTHLSTSPALPLDHKDQPRIDCVVTPWSDWSQCSHTCGNGRKERRRMIKLNPENGGKPCPNKLVQRRKCKDNLPCPDRMEDKKAVDCILNPWSDWTPCSKTCGDGGVQQRTKTVKQPPKNNGAACGPKVERKYCPLPPCPLY